MKYAIEICMDVLTTQKIIDYWQLLRKNNLAESQTIKRPYVPHISLSVTTELDEIKFNKITEDIAKKNNKFKLLFTHLGIFRAEKDILFLAPLHDEKLRTIQLDVHNNFIESGVKNWFYYEPNRWVPHCAITARNSYTEIIKALELSENIEMPFEATAEKIVLVNFLEGIEICEYMLK